MRRGRVGDRGRAREVGGLGGISSFQPAAPWSLVRQETPLSARLPPGEGMGSQAACSLEEEKNSQSWEWGGGFFTRTFLKAFRASLEKEVSSLRVFRSEVCKNGLLRNKPKLLLLFCVKCQGGVNPIPAGLVYGLATRSWVVM